MRLAIAVLAVGACAWGMIWGWGYLGDRTQRYVEEAMLECAYGANVEIARLTESFEIADASRLTIENEFGSVQVKPGGPELSIEGIIYAPVDDAQAGMRAAQFAVVGSRESDGVLRIMVEDSGTSDGPRLRVDLVTRAPVDIPLHVRVAAGSTDVHDRRGSVDVTGGSGGIRVLNIRGDVVANTGSGSISVRDVGGRADVETGSGPIHLADIDGGGRGKTGSGSIRADDIDGGLSAISGSGSLHLRGIAGDSIVASTGSGTVSLSVAGPFSGEMEVHTASGSITIGLPARSNCQVEASTGSGSVSSSLPLTSTFSSLTKLRGTLGAGEGRVQVTAGCGSIRLEAGHMG
jgi:hypothetical protein